MSDIEPGLHVDNDLDLSVEATDMVLPTRISVDGSFLALDKWEELLRLTQETGMEHGLVISKRPNKRLLTSHIVEGHEEEYEVNGQIIKRPAILSQAFPHGFRSLLRGVIEIVDLHTHPVSPENSHLTTTAFSDLDIEAYVRSQHNASVMLDRGGVHMLVGRRSYIDPESVVARRISTSAIKTALGSTKSMAEVRAEMARSLSQFGISYYFSPGTQPPSDGRVHFTKL